MGKWFITQLATPSTHNALALVAMQFHDVIPAPWNSIVVLFFAALGIVIPESGEHE